MSERCCKALDSEAITDEQLEQIGRYARRAMDREELFVFSVVLCDNEIDRDGERFPAASLEKLAELFPGKTGVFDHKATAENQSARIFAAWVEDTGEQNSVGEPYAQLKAWAYLLRCDKNADLILEIDGGIKKEVSVSCAVDEILCAICGADQREGGCAHRKGEVYEGRLCHHLLVEPTDAFEWSFVAVPAQKNAGVVKRYGGAAVAGDPVAVDKAALQKLERLADLGLRYQDSLRERVVKLGLLAYRDLPAATLRDIAAKLDAPELEALEKSFRGAAEERYPLSTQLGGQREGREAKDAFQI